MSDEQNSDAVPEDEGFSPADVVDDPEFDETAFVDDELVENDEPMAADNPSTDPNPTQIQDEGYLGGDD